MVEPPISATDIRSALQRLAERLERRGIVGEVYVFGGGAMVLAYNARDTTRDIDAVFTPHGPIHDETIAVAEEMGLPRYWLNEQASVYLAHSYKKGAATVFDHPGLRVLTVSPRQLLAMKALAARLTDEDDIAFLARHLGLDTVDEVAEVVAEVFPEEPLSERARRVIEESLEDSTL